jgi:hypothetical protein
MQALRIKLSLFIPAVILFCFGALSADCYGLTTTSQNQSTAPLNNHFEYSVSNSALDGYTVTINSSFPSEDPMNDTEIAKSVSDILWNEYNRISDDEVYPTEFTIQRIN